ncbi:MAG: ComF family protein [Deltaproteobacteria bacterium]|nr:ComF family protein [Deltaproteobacteria bacterium]
MRSLPCVPRESVWPLPAPLRLLPPLLLHALSSPYCSACDLPLDAEAVFCAPCARALLPAAPRRPSPPGTQATPVVSYAAYGGPLRDALRRLKYGGRPDLGRLMGELALRAARGLAQRPDVAVPVPLHRRRLAERGFNQAALIAGRVAADLGVPLRSRALLRTADTPPQAGLSRAARRANVRGAFVVSRPDQVRGRLVLLVDDIVTTGATLDACAAVLRASGARDVLGLTVAQAE